MTSTIDTVHLIFKTHLDIGFTDFARNVIWRYFEEFIPQAVQLARRMRDQNSPYRFRWTTGSWLIYQYLEQASPADRRAMEDAIAAGDIIWHGLPFTTHTELMDVDLFRFGLSLSQKLDQRFGKKTIAAKMTDVPGHTRAIVPLLAEAGIRFLHIGVNEASPVPGVPPVFVWRDDASDMDITMMYHKTYGELSIITGFNQAISIELTGDNLGPLTERTLKLTYDRLQQQFPDARIVASTMDAYAAQLEAIRASLPVVSAEIGDTWIHGAGSDPVKVSQLRELCALRRAWMREPQPSAENQAAIDGMNHALMMVTEHTWGLDVKTHLANVTDFAPADFRRSRSSAPFQKMAESWAEQRAYISQAVVALQGTSLHAEAQAALADLAPQKPDLATYQLVEDITERLETRHFVVGLDKTTGAIDHLVSRADQREWASAVHLLGLVQYETFDQADYDRFWAQFIRNKDQPSVAAWAVPDYTKPGIAGIAEHRRFVHTRLEGVFRKDAPHGIELLIAAAFSDDQQSTLGTPESLCLQYDFPDAAPEIVITLQWFGKEAYRLPEAFWMSFSPVIPQPDRWQIEKLGMRISPNEVIRKGNRTLHAIDSGVFYEDGQSALSLYSLDAPLVAPGSPALLSFPDSLPSLAGGMHFNLCNNTWGTNFPQWIEGDARFRFRLVIGTP